MRRRPDQMSMLSLMGEPGLEPQQPFQGFKLHGLKQDQDGNVLSVTTVGPECPSYSVESDQDPWWDQPAYEEEQ